MLNKEAAFGFFLIGLVVAFLILAVYQYGEYVIEKTHTIRTIETCLYHCMETFGSDSTDCAINSNVCECFDKCYEVIKC